MWQVEEMPKRGALPGGRAARGRGGLRRSILLATDLRAAGARAGVAV